MVLGTRPAPDLPPQPYWQTVRLVENFNLKNTTAGKPPLCSFGHMDFTFRMALSVAVAFDSVMLEFQKRGVASCGSSFDSEFVSPTRGVKTPVDKGGIGEC